MSDRGAGIIMKISSKVTSNQKDINNFLRRLQALEESEAQYGYFDEDVHKSSGLKMSDLAAFLSYGDKDTPPRTFMLTANDSAKRWAETSNQWKVDIWRYLYSGGGVNAVLKKIGTACNRFIPQAILYGGYARNVDWWAKVKFDKYQESQPLIETKELMNGSKVKVVKVNNEKT